jgi:hypothetical protein
MKLVATFRKDRSLMSELKVTHSGGVETFLCLGKADDAMAAKKRNKLRDPRRPYGDTPTGTWTARLGVIQREARTYGPYAVIMLWPESGQAKEAYEPPNPRSGIWIHGGDLNSNRQLRPTFGCIRVSNETMARLVELLNQNGRIATLETKEDFNV